MDQYPATQPYRNPPVSAAVNTVTPIPYGELRDRTVVITGGASGIGASIARTVAEHGGNAIIGDLSVPAGEKLIAELRQTTKRDSHHFIGLDVTSWQSQADFFKQAALLSPHGGIDTVVANAGIAGDEEVAFANPVDYSKVDNPPEPSHKIMNVNLMGVLYTTELALSYLSRNPGSSKCSSSPSGPRDRHLLLVSSIAGLASLPGQALYCASKHALVGLFRSLRCTSPGSTGVRVNMLNPYFTNTPILGPLGPLFLSGAALSRLDDVAGAAVRMIADKKIIGRALMIVSRGSKEEVEAAGLDFVENDQHGNAVRDVFGDDMAQTDAFVRRMIGLTNVINAGKDWTILAQDLIHRLALLIWKLVGR